MHESMYMLNYQSILCGINMTKFGESEVVIVLLAYQ